MECVSLFEVFFPSFPWLVPETFPFSFFNSHHQLGRNAQCVFNECDVFSALVLRVKAQFSGSREIGEAICHEAQVLCCMPALLSLMSSLAVPSSCTYLTGSPLLSGVNCVSS